MKFVSMHLRTNIKPITSLSMQQLYVYYKSQMFGASQIIQTVYYVIYSFLISKIIKALILIQIRRINHYTVLLNNNLSFQENKNIMMRKAVTKMSIPKQKRLLLDEQFKQEKVQLSEKNITDDELKYCSEKIVIYIKKLQLNQNNIGPKGISYIYGLKWKNLLRIELMSNKIGNRGCHYLSRMKKTTLATLFLNNNQIDSSGMIHLFKAQWKNLKTLVLYYNQIEEGVALIPRACWMGLTGIHLSWCNIKPKNMIHLLLGKWRAIEHVGWRDEQDGQFIRESDDYYGIFKHKFPKMKSFNTVVMIRHMTS